MTVLFDLDQYLEFRPNVSITELSPTSKIIRTGWFDNVHNWTADEYEYDYLNGYLEHDYYDSIEEEFMEYDFHVRSYYADLIKHYSGSPLFLRNGDEMQLYLMQIYYADKFIRHGFGGYIRETAFEAMKDYYASDDCPF